MKNIIGKLIIMLALINIFLYNYENEVQAKEQINFKSLTIRDGLTQGTIEALFQDSKGYIWIGTNDGLNRYNGNQFKVYKVEENTEKSLANNYILDIKEDAKGNIWVATVGGISKIHNSEDGEVNITNYLGEANNGNLSNITANSILITKNQEILVGTVDGLNIYNENSDRFERIFEDNKLINQHVTSLTEDNAGDIWVGTEGGINKISLKSKTSEHIQYSDDKESINNIKVKKIYYDNKGYIWVGTYTQGLYRIDLKTYKVTNFKNIQGNKKSLGGNLIKDILRDSNNDVWVATENGLSKYDEKNNSFTTYENKTYDRNSIVNSNIFSLIQDRTGIIWIGTNSGVSIFNPNSEIIHYKNDPFNEKTITDNMITALYEDYTGALWMGSKYSGVDVLNRYTDRLVNLSSSSESYKDIILGDDVRDIDGHEEYIYIATNNGLNIINRDKNTVESFTSKDGLPSENIMSIMYDDLGYLWIGTTKGLVVLDIKSKNIIDLTYILEKYFRGDTCVGDIFKDSDGQYWIGGFVQGGIIRIDPINDEVYSYKNEKDNKNSLSSNSIRSINESKDGDILIGTNFALNKFNKETESFRRYTVKSGLANDAIYGVLVDNYNNIWCSTNAGISRINVYSNKITNLDVTDGLQSSEFNRNAYFKTKNGELLFGGINGFNIIDPKKIKESSYKQRLVIDEFKVNGVSSSYSKLKNLSYYENNIYIEVFLPDYKNTESIQYYYKLEGGKNEWIEMNKNSITLSNLSTGKYNVKIRARGTNGIISDEARIEFEVNPPFWKNKYAILIYILLGSLFIIYEKYKVKRLDNMVAIRTRKLNEEMNRNKQLFDKVLKLEKSKNNYLINLSHELRTPLNVIYSTEQLIRELNKSEEGIEKDKLNNYMGIMRNNTKRLLKIINDLIDTSKIEHGSYNLEMKELNIVNIVEDAALSLRQYIEEKGIELIVDPQIEEKIIEADENEIERCIINIVGNACKFTNSGGYIKVEVEDLGDSVKIEIIDNGIGIAKEHQELIFNRFNQIVDANSEVKKGSGLGLTITKKIIELHNGKIYVESEVGEGSKFIIILPCSQEKYNRV